MGALQQILLASGGIYTIVANGGIISEDGNYRVHIFTSSGTLNILNAPLGATYEVLIVGGGGGGTQSPPWGGNYTGGGGAGGVLTGFLNAVASSIPILIGAGGAGANGSNTTFGGIHVALGGGYATGLYQGAGVAGGSGGGGNTVDSFTGAAGGAAQQNSSGALTGYGFPGGTGYAINNTGAWSGGGGGAGGAGGNASSYVDGIAGAGIISSITGTPITYAQGGAQGSGPGAPNSGNGGGGGANGGSGIVIVRYLK